MVNQDIKKFPFFRLLLVEKKKKKITSQKLTLIDDRRLLGYKGFLVTLCNLKTTQLTHRTKETETEK